MDARLVPPRAVLLADREVAAALVDTRDAPRVVQEHQREQSPHLGVVGHQLAQQQAQPDRLVTQLFAHETVALGSRVALVEDQVDHAEHPAHSIRQILVGRHLIRDPSRGDLPLGPHDSLTHRRLGNEERARDLAGREATERAQRERHPSGHIERRVTAGEDQPQAIVDDRALFDHGPVLLLVEAHELREALSAIRHRAVAAQAIDRAPPRRDGKPRTRIRRNAVARPRRERSRIGVLNRVLRQLEIAHMSNQRGQHGRPLVAKRAGDRIRRRITQPQFLRRGGPRRARSGSVGSAWPRPAPDRGSRPRSGSSRRAPPW